MTIEEQMKAVKSAIEEQMAVSGVKGPAATQVAERRAEIPYELEALGAELSRVDGLVASLVDRLAPVISGADAEPRALEQEPSTKLGYTIRDLRVRVERVGDVLGAVHRGLEL